MAQTLNPIRIHTETKNPLTLLFPQSRTVGTVATRAIELENDQHDQLFVMSGVDVAPIDERTFKVKIALQNLHDGPRLYAKGFAHHVCACEREFVEKGAQAF
jgi:hypothetical protein